MDSTNHKLPTPRCDITSPIFTARGIITVVSAPRGRINFTQVQSTVTWGINTTVSTQMITMHIAFQLERINKGTLFPHASRGGTRPTKGWDTLISTTTPYVERDDWEESTSIPHVYLWVQQVVRPVFRHMGDIPRRALVPTRTTGRRRGILKSEREAKHRNDFVFTIHRDPCPTAVHSPSDTPKSKLSILELLRIFQLNTFKARALLCF